MGKLDDLEALVSEHESQARRGFLSLAELAEDCDALDEAEEQVLRAHKRISDKHPEAVAFFCEWFCNHPRYPEFIAHLMTGDPYWTGDATDINADATSAYAERGLE